MAFSRRQLLHSLGLMSLRPRWRFARAWSSILALRAGDSGASPLTAGAAAMADRVGERPEDQLRSSICLNGDWETIENVAGTTIPVRGWTRRRVPAMPLASPLPVASIWYRLKLEIPGTWAQPDRRFFLQFGKVGHYAAVYWNGQRIAEHYGQYTPFEADVTAAVHPGERNEIAVFVHNAFGPYARPGTVLNDPVEGNAYRGATIKDYQRNWTGIVGNIRLGWHPAPAISDVFVIPSVRHHRLSAELTLQAHWSMPGDVRLCAAVLDGGNTVLQFPTTAVSAPGVHRIAMDWADPVLWGPAPYGQPKLYNLRVDLLQHGKLVDRRFIRFGFREVWIEGRDVLLNGKKLWVAGTYFNKLAPIRYLNDRHSQARMIEVMQQSGLNLLHGHWDELGETWLDLCDEMGMLVLGGFFCDGRPDIQSKADPGWVDWMADTCAQWVRANRNHPSIVIWRPMDVVPQNLINDTDTIYARLAAQVRREDGTRPLADGSDIETWTQGSLTSQIGQFPQEPSKQFDDGSEMARALAASTKPFLTKEIYTYFPSKADDIRRLTRFFREFYAKAHGNGGTGLIVQHLPLIDWRHAFHVTWLSLSGDGNRDGTTFGQFANGQYQWLSWSGDGNPAHGPCVQEDYLPNWCDARRPFLQLSPYNGLFAGLYRKFMQVPLPVYEGPLSGEFLLTGLQPDALAMLTPEDTAQAESVGIRAGQDGTAWVTALAPGRYRLFPRSVLIQVHPRSLPRRPGYAWLRRIKAGRD